MTLDQELLTYGLLLIAAIFAVALIYLIARRSRRAKSPMEDSESKNGSWHQGTVKQDWLPTRRIDFATRFEIGADNRNKPTEFKLLVEEQRIVESVAGNEKLEIHWRLATLEEAKTIVSHYNKYLNENSLIVSVRDESASLSRPMTIDAHPVSKAA